MKLYDYIKLMPEGEQLTVWDKEYDIEIYFYGWKEKKNPKLYNTLLIDLSKLLTIKEIRSNGVIVDLSYIIEKKIDKLNDEIFKYDNIDIEPIYDLDYIMELIEDIMADRYKGVLQKFVEILKN